MAGDAGSGSRYTVIGAPGGKELMLEFEKILLKNGNVVVTNQRLIIAGCLVMIAPALPLVAVIAGLPAQLWRPAFQVSGLWHVAVLAAGLALFLAGLRLAAAAARPANTWHVLHLETRLSQADVLHSRDAAAMSEIESAIRRAMAGRKQLMM